MTEIRFKDGGYMKLEDSTGEAISEAWHHMLHEGLGVVIIHKDGAYHVSKEDWHKIPDILKEAEK